MPATIEQILEAAEKLGQMVAQHPAVEKYKQAQKSVTEDADASRLLSEFDRQLQRLAQQEHSGMPVTDAQRQQLEALQTRIVSHIKIKALNLANVEFVDLLRKVNQTIQRPVMGEASKGAAAPAGSRLAVPPA